MSLKKILASMFICVGLMMSAQETATTATPKPVATTSVAPAATTAPATTAAPAPVKKDQASLDSGTIESQFNYVIKKSNKYEDYKVVKKTWLFKLKAHTIDTLNGVKKHLADTQAVVLTQGQEINGLNTSLAQTKAELDKTILEKDSMSIMGMLVSKSGYNGLIFSIIGILVVLLGFFIYRFKNSNAVTKESKQALVEIEEEFAEHRKRALEREQKVMRQLQDELNKKKKASK